jgi:hypothetical protein
MQISRLGSRCIVPFYGKIRSGKSQLSTFYNPGGKKYSAEPVRRGDLRAPQKGTLTPNGKSSQGLPADCSNSYSAKILFSFDV